MNGRSFTRVNYCMGASITYGSNVVICNTDNLSLRGMYLKTVEEIPLNIPVDVTLYHSCQPSIKFNANVIRKVNDGIGLQINKVNASSFAQLRAIISEHHNDYGKLMQETFTMLNCIS